MTVTTIYAKIFAKIYLKYQISSLFESNTSRLSLSSAHLFKLDQFEGELKSS